MATTAWLLPTSADTSGTGHDWLDQSAAATANNALGTTGTLTAQAYLTPWAAGVSTRYLRLKAPDVSSIPSGSTINGIAIRLNASASHAELHWKDVQLMTGGSLVGTAKTGSALAAFANGPYRNSDFGGAADLWGKASWSLAELATIWVAVRVHNADPKGTLFTATPRVDYGQFQFTYTAGASGAGNPNTVGITRRRR